MALVTLFETHAAVDGNETLVDLRFCTGRGYNHPSAPGYYTPRITSGAGGLRVKQSIFSDRRKFGFGDTEIGSVVLANNDRGLDHLIEYGYGRAATIRLVEENADYLSSTVVANGLANQILPSRETLSIGWRENAEALEVSFQNSVFDGNNSGIDGLEGTEGTIKGETKPYVGGRAFNVSPIVLNTSTRIMGWRWNRDGLRLPSASLDVLRVLGNDEWVLEGDYIDAVALQAANPVQGEYSTCLAESLIKIGGGLPQNLTNVVSVDVTVEADATSRYVGSQLKACLLHMGVDSSLINDADIDYLNINYPYEVGYYVREDTARDVMDNIMAAAMVCCSVDGAGVYRFTRLEPLVSQAPLAKFKRLAIGELSGANDGDIIEVKSVFSGNQEKDVPLHKVQVGYAKNWLVLDSGTIAAAVGAESSAALSKAFRYTDEYINEITLAKYPLSENVIIDSLLVNKVDAEQLALDLLALWSEYRLNIEIEVKLTVELAAILAVGMVVELEIPMFNFSGGRLGQVMEYELDSRLNIATLKLWMASNV